MPVSTFTVFFVNRDEDNTSPTGKFTFRSVDQRFVNNSEIIHSTLIEVDVNDAAITLIQNVGGYEVEELIDGADPIGPYIIPGTTDINLATVDPDTAHFDASGVVNVAPPDPTSVTTYDFTLSDCAEIVKTFTAATAVAARVDGSVTIPIGSTVSWFQKGAGRLTFSGRNGAVVHAIGGVLTSQGQYAQGTIHKYSATEWVLAGEIG